MTMTHHGVQTEKPTPHRLEWTTGLISTLLVAGLFGWVGYEALTAASVPPDLTVHALSTEHLPSGWRVTFEVKNHAPSTAASVEIRGEILESGQPVEESEVTFDYVPGHSKSTGSLSFIRDPNGKSLRLRAVGMAEP
ncbi:TIGR02588 family protein [Rhizobium paknamense]|uniref:Uncharacterized protein (TIGR02588 family) n=1 Tax=Rhizobium paknamense TaxID=1206817 RepID=A0ABU0IC43_9HYPH|nr:TIGR02588 family protein [Rhizobium paknamense]MDQ0454809.1 uncharacterized protein (TIGR02588 family) [Rhizobium paknamense]